MDAQRWATIGYVRETHGLARRGEALRTVPLHKELELTLRVRIPCARMPAAPSHHTRTSPTQSPRTRRLRTGPRCPQIVQKVHKTPD